MCNKAKGFGKPEESRLVLAQKMNSRTERSRLACEKVDLQTAVMQRPDCAFMTMIGAQEGHGRAQ